VADDRERERRPASRRWAGDDVDDALSGAPDPPTDPPMDPPMDPPPVGSGDGVVVCVDAENKHQPVKNLRMLTLTPCISIKLGKIQ